jgi:hypothetical protein
MGKQQGNGAQFFFLPSSSQFSNGNDGNDDLVYVIISNFIPHQLELELALPASNMATQTIKVQENLLPGEPEPE